MKKNTYDACITILGKLLSPIDRFFNRVFSSKYNPLYRSGPIAVFLLLLATITGLYLIFFYRVGEPFRSVQEIHNQVWTGSWIRAVHRYASDLAMIAIVFHVLRVFVQRKSYGPRALPWISGVFLCIGLLIAVWTGYALVWNTFAQILTESGAQIFDSLGLFANPIARAFDGSLEIPPASFFFVNLFLHAVLPLLLLFVLWIHTAKMSRATWLPEKSMRYGISLCLLFVALLLPAPLQTKADLLQIPSVVTIDWYFAFWLPWASQNPLSVFLGFVFVFILLMSLPVWLKPKDYPSGVAYNDPNRCQGCGQCVEDCPYEAITMIPRTTGLGSAEIALVNPDLCTSCGLCSASCEPYTMGPDERRAGDQLLMAKSFLFSQSQKEIKTQDRKLLIICEHQNNRSLRMQQLCKEVGDIDVYRLECVCSLHMSVLEFLTRRYQQVVIGSCSAHSSFYKDGFELLRDRIDGTRKPTFNDPAIRDKIRLSSFEEGEEKQFFAEMLLNESTRTKSFKGYVALLGGLILCFSIAYVSQIPLNFSSSEEGYLRMSWRLAGQALETCSHQEVRSSLKHMQLPMQCTKEPVIYLLSVRANNKILLEKQIQPGGFKHDRPHFVKEDIALPEGKYITEIEFKPLASDSSTLVHLHYKEEIEIEKNRISLVYMQEEPRKLILQKRQQ